MTHQPSRREFLQTAAATGVGYWVAAGQTPKVSASPNERVAIAGIGVEGIGAYDITAAARFADIVAICDVDKGRLNGAQQKYPKAKAYTDYRKLFDEMGKIVDAATISTPDHMHAAQALMAMRMKKHVYVQKPLTRTIYESRLMAKVAKEMGVCTQMGNQGSASDGQRLGAAEIKAGVFGDVKEIHVVANYPFTFLPDGTDTVRTMKDYEEKVHRNSPNEADQLIAAMKEKTAAQFNNLEWDLWIGTAKPREFFPGEDHPLYHPAFWRRWWAFGTGQLGDFACHALSMHMKALDLSAPTSVVARTSGHDFDIFPISSEIVFEYPDTPTRKGFKFVWYDGGWAPSQEFVAEHKFTSAGYAIIGTEGVQGPGRNERKQGVTIPEVQYAPICPDPDGSIAELDADKQILTRNVYEFITAIKENKPELCHSNFPDHAGPLAEAMLLGNLAVWTASKPNEWGEKIYWDRENMKIKNLADIKTPGVADLIKPVYRRGYELD